MVLFAVAMLVMAHVKKGPGEWPSSFWIALITACTMQMHIQTMSAHQESMSHNHDTESCCLANLELTKVVAHARIAWTNVVTMCSLVELATKNNDDNNNAFVNWFQQQ